jgi:hypothetical protein
MNRPIRLAFAAAALAVCGCAPASYQAPSRGDPGVCVALFRHYDYLDNTISETRKDVWAVPPALMWQIQQLRQAGCITMTDQLTLDATEPGVPGVPDGSTLALHAGVVTSDADDAAVRAYFEANGVRARSVGKPGLGRRVYLGPFASADEQAQAAGLARGAGFVAPYPARF